MKLSSEVVLAIRDARIRRAFQLGAAGFDVAAQRSFDAADRAERVWMARLNTAAGK